MPEEIIPGDPISAACQCGEEGHCGYNCDLQELTFIFDLASYNITEVHFDFYDMPDPFPSFEVTTGHHEISMGHLAELLDLLPTIQYRWVVDRSLFLPPGESGSGGGAGGSFSLRATYPIPFVADQ